jgi:hypothetical protein
MKLILVLTIAVMILSCANSPPIIAPVNMEEPDTATRLTNLYKPDYILALDFSAEQTDLPSPNYAAFYLVNSSDVAFTFWFYSRNLWGSAYYWDDRSETYSLCEVMADIDFRGGHFTLQPGEKVRAFSVAFNTENRTKHSHFIDTVYVNGQEKVVIAFVNEMQEQ